MLKEVPEGWYRPEQYVGVVEKFGNWGSEKVPKEKGGSSKTLSSGKVPSMLKEVLGSL